MLHWYLVTIRNFGVTVMERILYLSKSVSHIKKNLAQDTISSGF